MLLYRFFYKGLGFGCFWATLVFIIVVFSIISFPLMFAGGCYDGIYCHPDYAIVESVYKDPIITEKSFMFEITLHTGDICYIKISNPKDEGFDLSDDYYKNKRETLTGEIVKYNKKDKEPSCHLSNRDHRAQFMAGFIIILLIPSIFALDIIAYTIMCIVYFVAEYRCVNSNMIPSAPPPPSLHNPYAFK